MISAGNVTVYRHMAVLPGRGNVQSGLAASPFTEAKLYPSTDWEETFPSALSLTAQCHNYTNVFTPWTEEKQLYVDLTGDFRVAESSCFHFPLTDGVNIQLSSTFFSPSSQYDQSPLSPLPFPPPLGRFATRRAEFCREEAGGRPPASS